jgi:hypothetical protein
MDELQNHEYVRTLCVEKAQDVAGEEFSHVQDEDDGDERWLQSDATM